MRYIRFTNLQGKRSSNPFIQALGLVVGVVLFIGAVLLGGLVIAALMGFLLVAGLILYVRVWWLTRRAGSRQQEEDSFVEAEYQVIEEPTSNDDQQR